MEIPKVIRAGVVDGSKKLDYFPERKKELPKAEKDPQKPALPPQQSVELVPTLTSQDTPEYLLLKSKERELQLQQDVLNEQIKQLQEQVKRLKEDNVCMQNELASSKEKAEAEGYQAGLSRAAAKAAEQTALMNEAVGLVKTEVQKGWQTIENIAAEIAFESIIKFVGQKYAEDPFLLEMVASVVNRMREERPVALHVAKSDVVRVKSHIDAIREMLGKSIRIVEDERIASGGCMLETTGGSLDGRLDSQLKVLRDTLINAVL